MEVAVNETKAEVMNLKALLKNWTTASVEIFHELNTFDESMAGFHDNIIARLPDMQKHSNVAAVSSEKAVDAAARIRTKNQVIGAMNFKNKQLEKKNAQLTADLEAANARVEKLEVEMESQIGELIKPLRLDVANAKADLMAEKAARTEDRIELADLWPPGWLMPSVLMKYKTMDVTQKAEKRKIAMELDAERALKEEIRSAVLEAGKWSEQYVERASERASEASAKRASGGRRARGSGVRAVAACALQRRANNPVLLISRAQRRASGCGVQEPY
jgi:hypothetical protein